MDEFPEKFEIRSVLGGVIFLPVATLRGTIGDIVADR